MRKLKAIVSDIIFERLKHFNFNRSHAAKSLGLSLRTVRGVCHKLRAEGYDVPEGENGPPKKIIKDCKDFQV